MTVDTATQPDLVAFRDEASASWQTVAVEGKSSFEIPISGPYRLVVVCHSGTTVGATQYARTPEDGGRIVHVCGGANRPFFVRGTVSEPGFIGVGDSGRGTSAASWDFAFPVAAGTYDVGMLFGPLFAPERIALQRDLEVTADVTLPTISAAGVNAVPLEPVTFTPTNPAGGETLSLFSELHTAHLAMAMADTSALPDGGWRSAMPPAKLLQAGDRVLVSLNASTEPTGDTRRRGTRGVSRPFRIGDTTEVTLPDALGTVAFESSDGHFGAPLAGVPTGADVTVWLTSFRDDFSQFWLHETRATQRFLADTGATAVAVDFRDVPAFQADWKIDPALQIQRGVDASVTTGEDRATLARVSEELGAADPQLRGPAVDALRRRLAR